MNKTLSSRWSLLIAPVAPLDRRDVILAVCIALFGLAVYTRVLAPDMLYGDSGEFQALAYSWGTTHTTGYPVYLILARLVGFIPIGTLAWRVNFFSALCAAITLGGVYLITRYFTRRGGALLASLVLLVSYTFWSQSIISEVYTPATAFIVVVLNMLFLWRLQPAARRKLLFAAGFVLTLGLGVHMFLMLIAPAVFLFVLWGVIVGSPDERWHWKQLAVLIAGMAAGFITFFLLFAFIDSRPTPTNIFATAMIPSRDAWGLTDSDFDTIPKRFWISVSGLQWHDRMLPPDADYQKTITAFNKSVLPREFTQATLLLAILGVLAALIQQRRGLALVGGALAVGFAAGLVYFPGDKYIFYLPAYVMLAILAGAGAGYAIFWLTRFLPAVIPRAIPSAVLAVILVAVCIAPFFQSRWKSIQVGVAGFVTDDYPYPVRNLDEPRRAAECALSKVPETDALLVVDWRALWSIYYVARVEQQRDGMILHEAMPYPSQVVTADLRAEISERLHNGEAVYVNDDYPPLKDSFTLTRVSGTCVIYTLFKLSLKS